MKKFLTALLALVLALAMAFAMVACEETEKDPNGGNGGNTEQGGNGGDNTGDNTGDGEEDTEEPLQPVDAKVFAETILEQISTAAGFSVTLNASAKGSTTVTDAAGVSTPTTIDESVSDTFRLDGSMSYISNTLNVLDDIWGLLGGVDGIEEFFAGTVEPLNDNSGYEYTITVETEQVKAITDKIQGFFTDGDDGKSQADKTTIGGLLASVMPETAPEGFTADPESEVDEATQIAQAWVKSLFGLPLTEEQTDETDGTGITVGELYDLLNKILTEKGVKNETNTVFRIVFGIWLGADIDFDAVGPLLNSVEVVIGEDGSVALPDENTPEGAALPLKDIPVSAIVDPILSQKMPNMTFESIGTMIVTLWDFEVSNMIDLLAAAGPSMGLPSIPTTEDIVAAKLETAELTIVLTTDKEMKLTGFKAEGCLKASYSMTTNFGMTVTNYVADITASASGTFGYEAAAAGDTGSGTVAA